MIFKCILMALIIVSIIILSRQFYKEYACRGREFNLNPNIWGPPTWFFIHSLAIGYPVKPSPKVKSETRKLLNALTYVLPCEECQNHLRQNLKKNPPKLNSRDEFFKWTIDLHNMVNALTNKPIVDKKSIIDLYKQTYLVEDSNARSAYSNGYQKNLTHPIHSPLL